MNPLAALICLQTIQQGQQRAWIMLHVVVDEDRGEDVESLRRATAREVECCLETGPRIGLTTTNAQERAIERDSRAFLRPPIGPPAERRLVTPPLLALCDSMQSWIRESEAQQAD